MPPDDPITWKLRLYEQLRSGEARRLREAVGVSQVDLAKRLQASRFSVVHWENGHHMPRDIRVIVRWIDALGAMRRAVEKHPALPPAPAPRFRTAPHANPDQAREEAASLPDESAEGNGDHQR